MSISATCDSCGKTYSVNEKFAGRSLPCKECGEQFFVEDRDDFDSPPRRPRREPRGPARSGGPPRRPNRPAPAKRKGGKKRRRSSGPNWTMIGIAAGAGVVLLGGLIFALMMLLPHSHDSLAKAALKSMREMANILESVTDKASAEAAVPRIERLGDRMADLYREERKLKETNPITEEKEKELEEKYDDERKALNERISKERRRLMKEPELFSIIQEPMSNIGKKLFEVSREEFDKKREEREQRMRDKGFTPPF